MTDHWAITLYERYVALYPSPEGHILSREVIEQALCDFSQLSTFAVLEPPAVAMICGPDQAVTVRQHRFVLLVKDDAVDATLGHLQAYAASILHGHPVTVELSTVGMVA